MWGLITMTRKFNLAAALATTATVALFAGSAFAQGGPDTMGAPMVCPTTQMSPAHQNCVMPTATAPGGGSFPGSFLVPGTNTSFALHGFIRTDIVHDFGPHQGVNAYSFTGQPIDGPGVTYSNEQLHAANGGTEIQSFTTRPDIQTQTPTAYGLLKTYIEFDFNQTASGQLAGNNELLRMRQAYGTLGPWLIGQTLSAFADPAAYADTANGVQDVGMLNTTNVRRPQFRYTWLVGSGLSVASSVEQQTYVGNVGWSNATDGAALTGVAVTGGTGAASSYSNWPAFVVAPEWDQPWGHLKFAAGVEINNDRLISTTPALSNAGTHDTAGYAFKLSGHLNTIGKDALRGGIDYDNGAATFSSEMTEGSDLYNNANGTHTSVKEWAGYVSYEHFFTGQWRANATGGYAHLSGNPGFTTPTTEASMNKELYDINVNVVYSPVPQTDFYLEWQRTYRKTFSSADGTGDRIDAQFNFYF